MANLYRIILSLIKSNSARISVLVILGCLFFLKAQAQLTPESVRVTFLKDTVEQTGNTFSFNRVSLSNSTSIKQIFGLDLLLPEGWQSLFDNHKVYQLEPGQSLELPLRIAAASNALSKLYTISLTLNTAGNTKKANYNYQARVQTNSKWKSSLVNPEAILNKLNKETYFQITLSNTGNVSQELSLNFNTGLALTLPKRNTRINLPAGTDTILQIGILADIRHMEEFKAQEIEIEISDASKNQQKLLQRVYSTNSIFRENPTRWHSLPLSVELVSQNFSNRQQQIYYVNSSGILPLENNRSISFNFRSPDFSAAIQNYGRYANVDYQSRQWKISLGDQTEFNNFLMNGTGARLAFNNHKGYRFNALGIKSRLGNSNQFSLNQELSVGKNKILLNKTEVNLDHVNQSNSLINILEYDIAMGRASNLAIFSGWGMESTQLPESRVSHNSQLAGLNYNYASPTFTARSNNSFSTKYFPGMERGVKRSSNEIRLAAKNFFWGAIADYNERQASNFNTNEFVYLFGGKTSEYGLRTGYNGGKNNLILTGSVVDQLQDSLASKHFRSNKLSLNAGLNLFKNINLSLASNLTKSFVTEHTDPNPVYSFNTFGTLQSKAMGLSFRVDRGPFYYAELMSYLNTGIKTNRYQLSPYVDLNFFKSRLNTRLELSYSNDEASKYQIYTARVDVNLDLKKQGLSLRFYGNHNFSQNNSNYLNLSIRKNFTLPLAGLQKYRSLKVVLFKDLNNNNIFDEGDEAISNADIRIQNQPFITNKNGEVIYKNIKVDKYALELGKTNNLKGWIAKNGIRQTLNLEEKNSWYIPYQQGRVLSGRLNLVKDPFSKLTFNPANIRITAIDSKGEIYSTLTDYDGNFSMNLPSDQYLIKINEKVFTEDFRVLQDSFTADLAQSMEADITFEIRERKRQINIRKSSGE